MADHQRVHPAAADVEAPPPTVPLVVPLPKGKGHGSSTTTQKDKETEKIQLLQVQHNNHSAPLQLQARTSGSTINPAIQARTSTSTNPVLIQAKQPIKRRSSSSSSSSFSSSCTSTCCRCMCWTLCILLLILIIIGATAGILYLIFHPKLPNYSVDSLKISDLRLNLDMTLYAKFDVKITANNPNKKIGIHYEQGGQLSVWYTNTRLCQGTLPKFYQGYHNKTLLNVALTGQTQYGNTLMNALQQQQQTGRIPLDLKVHAPVAIQLGGLKLKKVRILGHCLLVVDSLTANNLISIKANNCRFRLKL